jgi:peptidoglycan hydrolase-like protein with peptidoglycan-binding domain
MKKIIRLTEGELKKIIKKVINEAEMTHRTGNLSNPEEFLPSSKPKVAPSSIVTPPKQDWATYKLNYPNIQQRKTEPIVPKTIFGIGDKDPKILSFQKNLVALGYNVGRNGPDGIFGTATQTAVKDFQQKNGIKVSGRVGPPTMRKLAEVVKAKSQYDPNADYAQDRAKIDPITGKPKTSQQTQNREYSTPLRAEYFPTKQQTASKPTEAKPKTAATQTKKKNTGLHTAPYWT